MVRWPVSVKKGLLAFLRFPLQGWHAAGSAPQDPL